MDHTPLSSRSLGSSPPRRRPSLHVFATLLALMLAAAAGAGVGLIWQGSGLADEEEPNEGERRLLEGGD